MKTIKTRNTVKNIKILDKSANLTTRMKNAFVRTKEMSEETQNSHHASPSEYASDNIQDTAKCTVEQAVHRLPNPRHKARESIDRAKGHFQEVKRQLPKERKRAAEQAQKSAQSTKNNSEKLKNTADKAVGKANDANTAVKDAKNTLREVRQSGRQTLREVKQVAKAEQSGKPPTQPGKATSSSSILPKSQANAPKVEVSTPNYMSGRIIKPKNVGDTPKSLDKTAKTIKSTKKGLKETAKGTVKTAKKSVKTAEKSAKVAVKTAQQTAKTAQATAKAAVQAAKVAERAARVAAKVAVQTAKAAAKAITALVKATIAAIKGLIAAIAAGGWVAVLIILIVCMIGLLVGSIFGIFFSSEPNPSTGQTINSVITEIDSEYRGKIDEIINGNAHDFLDMSGARAGWKEVLSVYTVKTTTDPDNPMEVATVDDEKAAILRSVFWKMNVISHSLDSVDVVEDVLGDDGLPTGETTTTTKTVLRITVTHKTPEEVATQNGFNDEQNAWLQELLKPEYNGMWNTLLYGITTIGDGTMIEVAITQLGNIGGEPSWSWYGFDSRVEWCACFVSWVAEQCGYVEAEIIPRFSGCSTGVQWFRDREQWQDNSYTPKTGDIIFFDWEGDGGCDHVGIVENVADGVVNTIEGNTSDSCARRSYEIGSSKIYGYGVPAYN